MSEAWESKLKPIRDDEIWCESCHTTKGSTHYDPSVSKLRLCRKCFVAAGGVIEAKTTQPSAPEPEIVVADATLVRPPRVGSERICQQCGQPFPAKRADARFCSPACRQRSSRMASDHPQNPCQDVVSAG
jgi:Zn finger protein HypA/HybF involved in hydrogenase expression